MLKKSFKGASDLPETCNDQRHVFPTDIHGRLLVKKVMTDITRTRTIHMTGKNNGNDVVILERLYDCYHVCKCHVKRKPCGPHWKVEHRMFVSPD
jgi:hypothetical protein